MKKLLLTFFAFISLFTLRADAALVVIDNFGETSISADMVSRTLVINSDDGNSYNITMCPTDEAIMGSDGTTIPLDKLRINNNVEDVYFRFNEETHVIWASTMEEIPRSMTAKIVESGIVPKGDYTVNFQVIASDVSTGDVVCTTSFTLRFVVGDLHELNTRGEQPNIKIGAEDAFAMNKKVANETSTMLYITSNTDWVLTLDTTNFDNSIGNYYVRTTAASTNVTSRLQESALVVPDREIILARGKAPAKEEFVTVEYSIESTDGKIIPAGTYENSIRYLLREGEE